MRFSNASHLEAITSKITPDGCLNLVLYLLTLLGKNKAVFETLGSSGLWESAYRTINSVTLGTKHTTIVILVIPQERRTKNVVKPRPRTIWKQAITRGCTEPNTGKLRPASLRTMANWMCMRTGRRLVSFSASQIYNRIQTFSPQIVIKQLWAPGTVLGAEEQKTESLLSWQLPF